ncbi:hypothetical protein L873DRAFT_1809281, partial [Choiromyces venosus 120613-1]
MIAIHSLKFYCCNCSQKAEAQTSPDSTSESLVTSQAVSEPPMDPRTRPTAPTSGRSPNTQSAGQSPKTSG